MNEMRACPISNKLSGGVWKEFLLKPFIYHFIDFKGRMSRKSYWLFLLLSIPVFLLAALVDNLFGWDFKVEDISTGYGWTYCLLMLAFMLPGISAVVRRLHDVGKRGWWIFIILIPLVGGIWLLILLCRRGSESVKGVRFTLWDTIISALMFILIASALLLPKLAGPKLYIDYYQLPVTCDGKFRVGRASLQPIAEAMDLYDRDQLVIASENKPSKLKSILSTSQFNFGMPSMFHDVLPSSVYPTIVYFNIDLDMEFGEVDILPGYSHSKFIPLYGKIDIKTGKYELFPGGFIGLITQGSFKNCYLCIRSGIHYIFRQSPVGENLRPVASFDAEEYGVDSMYPKQLIEWLERQ